MKEWVRTLLLARALAPFRRFFKRIYRRIPVRVRVRIYTGQTIYVDLRSHFGHEVAKLGLVEPELSHCIAENLRPGDLFVDVGAHQGYFSLIACSQTGDAGFVHAFEIDPGSLRCLDLTKRRNHLGQLRIHGVAIGEYTKPVALSCLRGAPDYTLVQEYNGKGVAVPMNTLDHLASLFERPPSLIKISVVGAELGALRGASELLRGARPGVVCALNPRNMRHFSAEPGDAFRFMKSLGYENRLIDPESGDPHYLFTAR